jgi:hypothetical protein
VSPPASESACPGYARLAGRPPSGDRSELRAPTLKQLQENPGAAELHLNAESTAALEKLSLPTSGDCPARVHAAQRERPADGTDALTPVVANGSNKPLGRRRRLIPHGRSQYATGSRTPRTRSASTPHMSSVESSVGTQPAWSAVNSVSLLVAVLTATDMRRSAC